MRSSDGAEILSAQKSLGTTQLAGHLVSELDLVSELVPPPNQPKERRVRVTRVSVLYKE
jgi:hypothetical protein